MAETFLSTLYWYLYLHFTLFIMHVHIFIMHSRRDTENDIVIQMILEHVLVQRFKKKEMDEKNYF